MFHSGRVRCRRRVEDCNGVAVPVWRWRCSQRAGALNRAYCVAHCFVSRIATRPLNTYVRPMIVHRPIEKKLQCRTRGSRPTTYVDDIARVSQQVRAFTAARELLQLEPA